MPDILFPMPYDSLISVTDYVITSTDYVITVTDYIITATDYKTYRHGIDFVRVMNVFFVQLRRNFCGRKKFRIFACRKKKNKRMNQKYPSVLLENAVNELSSLPGVGRKTALRLALYMLRRDVGYMERFSSALLALRRDVKYCRVCHNICDDDVCAICSDPHRDHSTLCVVENIKEVMAIENTGQFRGVYHVLGGIISPMDGIGPGDLQIESLVQRVDAGEVKEVVLALSTTMEGDTTNFFIYRKLSSYDVKISVIARGVSIGDEIEYADEITLGRSIVNRTSFNDSIKV